MRCQWSYALHVLIHCFHQQSDSSANLKGWRLTLIFPPRPSSSRKPSPYLEPSQTQQQQRDVLRLHPLHQHLSVAQKGTRPSARRHGCTQHCEASHQQGGLKAFQLRQLLLRLSIQ